MGFLTKVGIASAITGAAMLGTSAYCLSQHQPYEMEIPDTPIFEKQIESDFYKRQLEVATNFDLILDDTFRNELEQKVASLRVEHNEFYNSTEYKEYEKLRDKAFEERHEFSKFNYTINEIQKLLLVGSLIFGFGVPFSLLVFYGFKGSFEDETQKHTKRKEKE